ncbi:DnaJ-domain-containing protein [Amylocystis lapponica]|nr:DnaJ-domain-containing protein [Amylocystis lapponica]
MSEEEANPYDLLGVSLESTEAEIRTAYRQRSLKVHPDRNRGNPDAARKFHELNQAYELLLDPLRRMAVDAKMRVKEARKARFANYDAKRKGLVDELEERERAFKKSRVEKQQQEKERWHENERVMEEGRKLREDREKDLRRKEKERAEAERSATGELEPPALGSLDTTVRLKYAISARPSLTTPSSLSTILSPFGTLDESSIMLSTKPVPPKKPKRVTALVPFRQIGGAFAAVCASGRAESGLENIEVAWVEGKEPELIGWLKKMGKLGNADRPEGGSQDKSTAEVPGTTPIPPPNRSTASVSSPASTPFSTFPSTFPDFDSPPTANTNSSTAPGLDYESLTLMRLREAERARLEREIREREAVEGE